MLYLATHDEIPTMLIVARTPGEALENLLEGLTRRARQYYKDNPSLFIREATIPEIHHLLSNPKFFPDRACVLQSDTSF